MKWISEWSSDARPCKFEAKHNASRILYWRIHLRAVLPKNQRIFGGPLRNGSFRRKYNNLNKKINLICAHSEMDITMVFGTISSGSNPDGRATAKKLRLRLCFLASLKNNVWGLFFAFHDQAQLNL